VSRTLISIIKSDVGNDSPSLCAARWVRLVLDETLGFGAVDSESLELDVSKSNEEVGLSELESESSELDADSRVKHIF
jgi:hypothetical protein